MPSTHPLSVFLTERTKTGQSNYINHLLYNLNSHAYEILTLKSMMSVVPLHYQIVVLELAVTNNQQSYASGGTSGVAGP